MIKIDFERTDGTYTYRDAIVLPDDHTLTDSEIEQLQENRWQVWLEMVKNPPIPEGIEFDENGVPIINDPMLGVSDG